MIYFVQALRNKNKAIKPQKKPKKPMFKAQCKSCKYQLPKLQILRAKVANTKRRGKDRLLFNPKHLQDEDKSQRRRVQG